VITTGLFDPNGKTFREMTNSGFIFTRINEISSNEISSLEVLILGKDVVTTQFREQGKVLCEFVKNGGRVIILEQAQVERFDWLPYEINIDKSQTSTAGLTGRTDLPILDDITARGLDATVAFKMMPDHPILDNIEDDDLKYWRGTHQVAKNNFFRSKFWNVNTIAYVGSGNGIEHTPLVTLPYGSGVFVMTQFIISEEMSKEPVAYILFNNILKYSLTYSESFVRAGIFAADGNSTKRILTLFGAEVEHLDEFPPTDIKIYDVLFIDGSIDLDKYKSVLNEFLENGGKIILRELTPDNLNNVKCILPEELSLTSLPQIKTIQLPTGTTCPIRAYKTGYDPILAGITNFDLYWRSASEYRKIFGNEIAPIASYIINGSNMAALTNPTIIAKIKSANGEIIIDQIDWETGLDKVTDNTCRIISNFLNNLGIRMSPNITYNQ
jgi:hypothetical protein